MDALLFEGRQKNAASEVVRLEERWRMHLEPANILDELNSKKDKAYSLMNTNPLAIYN